MRQNYLELNSLIKFKNKLLQNRFAINWVVLFIVIFFMAYIRPIHQDDSWYATYAFRLIQKIYPENTLSYWSFLDVNGSDLSVGYIFSSLQVPFYLVFGINIFSMRFFNAMIIFAIVFLIFIIVKILAKGLEWISVIVLMLNQTFYYHFYNRPEIVAVVLVLLSTLLLLKSQKKPIYIFFAIALWGLIIDVHPIGLFSVFGAGLWYFIKRPVFRSKIILGGMFGLVLYLVGNWLVNNNFGLFNGVLSDQKPGIGDHYLPILESDLKDFYRIFTNRWDTFKLTFFFSGIWLMIPLLIWRKAKLDHFSQLIIFNLITFLILSTLFTEASSNGWALYALINFLLIFILLMRHIQESFYLKKIMVVLILIPLLIFSGIATARRLYINIEKSSYSRTNFKNVDWDACLPRGSKVLMRPTFAFALVNQGLWIDYPFGILNVMKENNINFQAAIQLRKYDFIALDERFLNNELLTDVRGYWTQAYYRDFNEVGISKIRYQELINQGFLSYHCAINEPLHGKTIVYRINNHSKTENENSINR